MRKGELIKCFMFICVHSDNHGTDYILDICVDLYQGLISLDSATQILKTVFWDTYNTTDHTIV